jgi:Acetyltransferase (GNAT) domain
VDGKRAAAQFRFRYRNIVHVLQEGFDSTYSADSVDLVLRAHVLRTLIGQGVRQYDFLGGQDPGKDRWHPQVGSYADIPCARPYTRGSAYLGLDQAARASNDWLRGNPPTRAANLPKRVYRISSEGAVAESKNKEESREYPIIIPAAPSGKANLYRETRNRSLRSEKAFLSDTGSNQRELALRLR